MRLLPYYKMRQKFISKCVRFFITKCDSFIMKFDRYCKMQRLLQNASVQYITIKTYDIILTYIHLNIVVEKCFSK